MGYQAREYGSLIGMAGFSETALNNHFTLYQGYVANCNKLDETLVTMLAEGRTTTLEYAELKRRMGFEFNGMRLHEYYFGNLGGGTPLDHASSLAGKLAGSHGSVESWKTDFRATGAMRGIGWVILYQDHYGDRLFNQWINEHEVGHFTGCSPLLVMDVFEHAYMTDYGLKRGDYIQAFFDNVDWDVVARRLAHDVAVAT